MQSELPPTRQAVLDALLAAGDPQSLDALHAAGVAGLSRSALLRQLQGMVEDGLVERRGDRKTARYVPVERLDVGWTARFGDRWRRMAWSCEPPFDWRYPLASRVPSAAARAALLRFLAQVDELLLHRPDQYLRSRLEASRPSLQALPPELRQDAYVHLTSPSSYGPCIVGVFGSAARGEDRDTSDVDVLVVLPVLRRPHENEEVQNVVQQIETETRSVLAERFKELAAEHSLTAARPLDLHVHNDPHMPLPKPLLATIRREGITVHTTGPHDFIERPESWFHD